MSTTFDRAPRSRALTAQRSFLRADDLYRGLLTGAAGVVFLIVVLIAYESATGAALSMSKIGWGFLVGTEWDPVSDHYGALPYVIGTLATSLLALLLATPLGIGSAVFLAELSTRHLGAVVSFVMELLAAIPSIVYGIWGFFVLAPFLRTTVEPWLIQNFG